MKRNYFNILAFLFLSSCVTVGTVKLDDDNLFHLEGEKTVKNTHVVDLKDYNGGVVSTFDKDGIGSWWGSSKILLTKKDGNLVVNAVGVGKEYDRFGYNFVPRVDFSTTNILKVRVKASGDRLPTLRIDLKDHNGYVTNNQDAKARLVLCDEYINYYYRYEGRFKQSWPFHADVDPTQIAQLEIFINPGGENFTGKLLIDEIIPISEELMWKEIAEATPPCDVDINTDFKNGIAYCWSNSDVYSLSYSENALLVNARNAGTDYQSFGMGFSMLSVTDHPTIKLRAKVIGDEAAQLRVDLVDFSGNVTNGDAIEFTIKNDGVYREYTFNYLDKLFQGWPTSGKVDSKYINELMLFINPGGPSFTGKLFIENIELDTTFSNSETMTANLYPSMRDSKLNIYNPSTDLNTWWSENNSTATLSTNKELILTFNEKGSLIGTGIDPIDFNVLESLIINTAKDTPVEGLELQIMDSRGEKSSFIACSKNGKNSLRCDISDIANSNTTINLGLITAIVFRSNSELSQTLIIEEVIVN